MSTSPRIDARDKISGRAKYVDDLPNLPGMTYGAVLLSPHSHARIVAIDSSKAERLPGVLAVLDREHLDGLDPMLATARHPLWTLPDDRPFIATDKVRFDGELIAEVVAEDLRTARKAVELIQVEYEVLPPVFDATEALSDGAPLVHDGRGTNLLLEDELGWGDVDQGFKESEQIFEETYTSPTMFHHPMENIGGCLAQFVNNEVTLWSPTAGPVGEAREVAQLFGLEPERVRVRVPYIGGGFGSKHTTPAMIGALFLSRKIGRPVRLLPSAQESFRNTARHAMVYKAKAGVSSDGTLMALDIDLVVDTGAYTTGGAVATHNAVISAWGCYRIPHFRTRAHCAYTNKVPASHTRATGKVQTTWGIECLMDSLAHHLDMAPIAFREMNVLRHGEFVIKDTPPMDTNYSELMERAVTAIQWDGRRTQRRADDKRSRGRGMAVSLRHGSQGGGRAYAMATVDTRGIVKIQHNTAEIGQGTHNLISIVASRTLGIPQSQVQVGEPDTALNLPFAGVSAQRTTMQMGTAVQNACENLKREIVTLAAQAKGGDPVEWSVVEGRLCRAENCWSFGEIVASLGGAAQLQSIGYYTAPQVPSDSPFGGLDHWAPSAGVAEVEVDRETGEIQVLQFAVVADAGKALHFLSAKGQVEGGAVMGFGHALFEEVIYQDGQLYNADPFQYRLPVLEDLPKVFDAFMIENEDGPGPFGSKGMSQTSIVTVAPAIGNAIYDAIGVRIRSLPITPEKILRAMGKI